MNSQMGHFHPMQAHWAHFDFTPAIAQINLKTVRSLLIEEREELIPDVGKVSIRIKFDTKFVKMLENKSPSYKIQSQA
ncbi:hypothetical protein F7734_17640 [Scytonema sp. UIC 10036]|uniref:hypothetical protein n=1 Tax=Scytonema sp. UIC 10036 TaxID=2304196 RepID=UPI0012DA2D64|nr:hypothetical protein [Scytonema sp. UIC 10036]MUG94114.1 hypothetical protein [Scytonema sp. UIC 10036]